MSEHTNKLAEETSPYLQQHAHNPVAWQAWGEAAFREARRRDVPIFLSVGYSTCYWCHVMERESFEDDATAALLNEHFVPIKVDREEHPDVDHLYMQATQVLTGQGGWPMSVFLLPDLRPFYAGTYFPKQRMGQMPAFTDVLTGLADAYHTQRDEILHTADQLQNILHRLADPPRAPQPIMLDRALLDELVQQAMRGFDAQHGGFGRAPKFPQETLLELLLTATSEGPLPQAVTRTLDAMADGGIRDHLGGGFHRYSVDAQWLVPHFEIMLYDQALLASVYAIAAARAANPRYADVARGICDFVLRDLTDSATGLFYSGLDAEVDAREGQSYLWTPQQARDALGDQADRFIAAYGLDTPPNFRDPHHPDTQSWVLHLPHGPAEEASLAEARQTLLALRNQRKQPRRDEKHITAWNALMVRGLAVAGRLLNEPRYLDAARRAADALLKTHRTAEGGLYRTSRGGDRRHMGTLEDYAYLAEALLELHRADADPSWQDAAGDVTRHMIRRFADRASTPGDNVLNGFFDTDAAAEHLLARAKVGGDHPLPSANAVAVIVLDALGHQAEARNVLSSFAVTMTDHPSASPTLIRAAMLHHQRHGDQSLAVPEPAAPRSAEEEAQQAVSLRGTWTDDRTLELELLIAQGMLIHATGTHQAVSIWCETEHVDVTWPKPEADSFGHPAYRDHVAAVIRFGEAVTSPVELIVRYQACDASRCLRTVRKTITATPGSNL